MCAGQYRVFAGVDQRLFFLRIRAPQYENEMRLIVVKARKHGIGKMFPASIAVRASVPFSHGEYAI